MRCEQITRQFRDLKVDFPSENRDFEIPANSSAGIRVHSQAELLGKQTRQAAISRLSLLGILKIQPPDSLQTTTGCGSGSRYIARGW
jgi:hypothetical protein